MAFKYEVAVPWGRSFHEYVRMFCLADFDLRRRILGCADGPASFNARMHELGNQVVSCDPIYHLTVQEIKRRIDATYEDVLAQTRLNQEKFIWDAIESPAELGRVRLEAMQDFLRDFEGGKQQGRYLSAELPNLPFEVQSFDLALCAHFLFFYSDSLSLEFHCHALDELCRVAREVRIFPVITYNTEPSPLVAPTMDYLKKKGRQVSIEVVPYEFQRGGNLMMRVL